MGNISTFTGFSKETIQFFKDIATSNNKSWFEQNRRIFDNYVMAEAQSFVVDMGEKLRIISPEVVAIPKVDKSIFRLYRDTRFSKDKSPYKTHLGIFFWDGSRKKMENSGYYFQLNADSIFVGVGLYMFPKDILQIYRDAVVDDKLGPKLVKTLKEIGKNPEYKIGGIHYKKPPRGYDPEHPHVKFLLHNGFFISFESKHPNELFSEDFVEYCFNIFKEMSPIHFWLRSVIENDSN